MRVFALSDPHLSLGTPGKTMDRFGPQWVGHTQRMAAAWDARVAAEDLVLVPGDISWASDLASVRPDLEWLAARPGTKLLIKGNHEHWWPASRRKLEAALPPGVRALQADAVRVGDVAVCGTRLWDVPGVSYHDLILWQGEPISPERSEEDAAASLKVYQREVGRLERALEGLDATAPVRIAMVHYPPVGPAEPAEPAAPEGAAREESPGEAFGGAPAEAGLGPGSLWKLPDNELTRRFEEASVGQVVFGHLHALDPGRGWRVGGVRHGVRYTLASVDFIDFQPVQLGLA
jgi:predicted phosphohydrolase